MNRARVDDPEDHPELYSDRCRELERLLGGLRDLVVAYSGGVDSSVLLHAGVARGAQRLDQADRHGALVIGGRARLVEPAALGALALLDALDRGQERGADALRAAAHPVGLGQDQRGEAVPVVLRCLVALDGDVAALG